MILDRMKHLETYEEQKGHQYRFAPEEEVLVRNAHRRASQVEEGFLCGVQECTKRCKSKAGLTIHKRRMHERARREFKCSKCHESFPAETNWINHQKACGGPPQRPDLRRCDTCGESFSKNNIARLRRICEARAGVAGRREEAMEESWARVYVPQVAPSPNCRRVLSKTNMARPLHAASVGLVLGLPGGEMKDRILTSLK